MVVSNFLIDLSIVRSDEEMNQVKRMILPQNSIGLRTVEGLDKMGS